MLLRVWACAVGITRAGAITQAMPSLMTLTRAIAFAIPFALGTRATFGTNAAVLFQFDQCGVQIGITHAEFSFVALTFPEACTRSFFDDRFGDVQLLCEKIHVLLPEMEERLDVGCGVSPLG